MACLMLNVNYQRVYNHQKKQNGQILQRFILEHYCHCMIEYKRNLYEERVKLIEVMRRNICLGMRKNDCPFLTKMGIAKR